MFNILDSWSKPEGANTHPEREPSDPFLFSLLNPDSCIPTPFSG
jgi:hypothetical protein